MQTAPHVPLHVFHAPPSMFSTSSCQPWTFTLPSLPPCFIYTFFTLVHHRIKPVASQAPWTATMMHQCPPRTSGHLHHAPTSPFSSPTLISHLHRSQQLYKRLQASFDTMLSPHVTSRRPLPALNRAAPPAPCTKHSHQEPLPPFNLPQHIPAKLHHPLASSI